MFAYLPSVRDSTSGRGTPQIGHATTAIWEGPYGVDYDVILAIACILADLYAPKSEYHARPVSSFPSIFGRIRSTGHRPGLSSTIEADHGGALLLTAIAPVCKKGPFRIRRGDASTDRVSL